MGNIFGLFVQLLLLTEDDDGDGDTTPSSFSSLSFSKLEISSLGKKGEWHLFVPLEIDELVVLGVVGVDMLIQLVIWGGRGMKWKTEKINVRLTLSVQETSKYDKFNCTLTKLLTLSTVWLLLSFRQSLPSSSHLARPKYVDLRQDNVLTWHVTKNDEVNFPKQCSKSSSSRRTAGREKSRAEICANQQRHSTHSPTQQVQLKT